MGCPRAASRPRASARPSVAKLTPIASVQMHAAGMRMSQGSEWMADRPCVHHQTPVGRGRRQAQAQERQRADQQQRTRAAQRELHHQQLRHVGQQLPKDDGRARLATQLRCLDVAQRHQLDALQRARSGWTPSS
jgi:hypothetical protein